MKLTRDRNQCPSCALYFNSSLAFDKHRTGIHGARRCRTQAEMVSLGMVLRANGFWVGTAMPESVVSTKDQA